jgi:hypothetical protein
MPTRRVRRGHDDRVVQVALGDECERTAQPAGQGAHLVGQLGQQMRSRVVAQLVDRVEPQRVEVEVAEPAQRVVDHEPAHLLRAGRRGSPPAPRRHVPVVKYGPYVDR